MSPKLKPKILAKLTAKTELDESSVREALSRIRRQYGFLTLNASAQIFAEKHRFSVMRHLDQIDRDSLSHLKTQKIPVPIKQTKAKTPTVKIAEYKTDDVWLQKHVDEVNRAFTFQCYTATFVLCRKILENLIVQILQKKYNSRNLDDRKKYFDIANNRFLDFGVLIDNLRDGANSFIPQNKLVLRICQLSEQFKDNANDMTHSLYYLARKKDIEDRNFQDILDLIKQLNEKM